MTTHLYIMETLVELNYMFEILGTLLLEIATLSLMASEEDRSHKLISRI